LLVSVQMAKPVELADKLRQAFPDYKPAPPGEALAYLDTLGLPTEIDAFYRSHSPTEVLGTESLLLTVDEMREEHEHMEPSMTIRSAGSCVLATANGNPYFVVGKGDTYEIRLVDHDEVSDDSSLDDLIEQSSVGPVFTSFGEFLDALAAQILPSSPHADKEVAAFNAWRAARGS
jgi:hypothetical protein